ncbi:SAM-dependent methyltransferase [Rhizobium sp. NFR07]|uniref:methyltransferase regulatory domain-containing protein n=1 Tax=Rhizobium sp. NFR07 TaxID=1566262 RepID=UPI0008E6AF44|nr:methyltransferase regulatory domain-containing protein [Rhizobium sp. NFR07]SFB58264.1 SAM-dependent methyltransferase [Rhizobium sp. NFR07]
MKHWTSGYVDGLDYTHGFYRGLTPAIMALAALSRGRRFAPSLGNLTYCELGCGQGFSANLLAAANPGIEIHANDFNPAHVVGAQALAQEAGLKNVHFYEHSFADFADEPALPAEGFDIIALHGIYSWISAEARGDVVDFISRKLKPGGIVYISFNTLPGWAPAMPLRRILVDQAARTSGPIAPRIDEALKFAESLMKANAGYFLQNPNMAPRLTKMLPMSRNYLAHEYFNRDWTPFYFEDVANELSAVKLTHVGSVNLLDHIDDVSLTDAQAALVNAETDPLRREVLRDFVVNEQFRTDIFVKGALPHSFRSAAGVWLNTRFALSLQRNDVSMTVKGRRGATELYEHIYEPILDAFAVGPMTVRQLLGVPEVGAAVSWEQLTRALTVLVGTNCLEPCLPEEGEEERLLACQAFNRTVCRRAEESDDLQFLASPVTGGGIGFDRFEQLFLLAISEGQTDPAQWPAFAWSILAPQGYRLLKDGRTIDDVEDNVAELAVRAERFKSSKLAVCASLKIGL